ncbi:MAG: hypothetical protein K0M55_02750 [Rhizobium sp.]|nr:hypothetical protein [Rhizobium sp.]MBW8321140.1 hypothetical protein [Rhizobium sp.]MBW8447894.1 hypothetical protein [Arenimonas sp.]
MGIALRRLNICPDCDAVLNAGLICELCGVVAAQTDLDCQQVVEHQPGASRFVRPVTINPSERWSDGNGHKGR